MHPAPSIIVFTTLSGLGFGLMAWLGAGAGPDASAPAAALSLLALALAAGGLLASLAHLGQPRRSLKALSQWRSSWLSREAVLSVATLATFTALTALRLFTGRALLWLGWPLAALALATVLSTAMIYAQMRTVPRWHNPLVPLVFLLAALAGGALLVGSREPALWLLAALGLAHALLWLLGSRGWRTPRSTLATATGLGALGRLRLFEPPHTGSNYLMREMVHVVGRRHALRLRVLGVVLAVLLPMLILLILPAGVLAAATAVASHAAGMLILRWLFFAEAEHVVGLYYGRR